MDGADIQPFPAGLRMVAGDSMATSPQDVTRIEWFCFTGPGFDTGVSQRGNLMPTCAPGQNVAMTIEFPQCWDGVNLDSPNHKSHMAFGVGWPNGGCPRSHPVPLPQITELVRWKVPATGMAGWRLSSDMNRSEPAGQTAHGDWMNGWVPDVFATVVQRCYRIPTSGPRDCSMNLLGDGRMLL